MYPRSDVSEIGTGDAPEDTEGRVLRQAIAHRMFGTEEEPTRIGRFAAIRLIGSGGMGRVYAAYDERLDRRVALKVLPRELVAHEHRVLREAKAMAKLSHPNVVQVYEVGEHGDRLFIAMEYVEGETLDAWRKAQPRTWRQVVDAYRQAARGLAAAHRAGLIHRDFKPRNAMVDSDPEGNLRVRVLDFGLVRLTDGAERLASDLGSEPPGGTTDDSKLTRADNVLGTPAYMAPEQFDDAAVTEAADQFSLCVALWEGLYGERPFSGRTLHALREAVSRGEPPRAPSGSDVPVWVHRVMLRGLATEPADRFPSMSALVEALGRDPAQRRIRVLSVGAAVAGLGIAVYAARAGTPPAIELCTGDAQQLDGVWDAPRRQQVEAAMLGTNLPYAGAAFERIASALDQYARHWREGYVDNCQATRVRGEQTGAAMDLRMSCLHRAKVQLDAVIDVLVDADAEVVDRAHEAAEGLPALSRCDDLSLLEADVEPPPAAEAKEVEAILTTLAEGRAQRDAGRYDEAEGSVAEAKKLARGVSYEPVLTDVSLLDGMVLESLGRYEEAEAALSDALRRASTWRQSKQQKDAALLLMYVLGYRLDRGGEALQHRPLLEGIIRDAPLERASLHNSLATVYEAQGKFEDAEREYRVALDLRTEAWGPDHPQTLQASNNVGTVLVRLGRYDEAEQRLGALVTQRETVLGAGHPEVAATRNNLAHAYAMQGRFDDAAEQMRIAIEIMGRRLGDEHPTLCGWRTNLATAYHMQEDYDKAEAEHRGALECLLETVGEDHKHVSSVRSNLAATLDAQGKHEEAEQIHRQIVQTRLDTLGPEHPEVAFARDRLGAALMGRGAHADAEALFRQALADLEAALGEDHPQVATVRDNLASALASQNELEEAEAHARRALAALEKALGPEHPDVEATRDNLAKIVEANAVLSR